MLDRELVEAVRLARAAGDVLLEIYATNFDVDFKGEQNPVTKADRLANELIVQRLREAFPHDGVVSEEDPDHSDALRGGRVWYVDPLDGTKEFIKRNGEFSVMIGLAIEGRAQLGVVYRPIGDRLYRGVVGDSAFVEIGYRTYTLDVSDKSEPSDLGLVVSRSHRSEAIDDLVGRLGISEEKQSGSVGLKVGLIAEREADLYVHLSGHSSVWDACAPDAILRASGGRFTDLGGRDFEYGSQGLSNSRGILACNANAFDQVLPIVRQVATEQGMLENDAKTQVDLDPNDTEYPAPPEGPSIEDTSPLLPRPKQRD